uniref:Uncharacterized protein n=1 Tax=Nothoprocta perdicaria TaxID=30464 RepID=A0A8C6Z7Z9_NOTPE
MPSFNLPMSFTVMMRWREDLSIFTASSWGMLRKLLPFTSRIWSPTCRIRPSVKADSHMKWGTVGQHRRGVRADPPKHQGHNSTDPRKALSSDARILTGDKLATNA